jgi:signal transduction histidine kinase/ActR/RegA family two-component response regulator
MQANVLLLALRGRDSEVIMQTLDRQGISCTECRSVVELAGRLSDDASAAIVTEESLEAMRGSGLAEWLENQPPWSDFPFILLATKRVGKRPQAAIEALEQLGNLVVLERPIHSETLVRAVESALRGRNRQREARRHLAELKSAEERLIQLNSTLEQSISERTSELSRANDRLIKEIAERERAQFALVQSQKMEAVGQLTGGIAHDFNNLLTVICGNLDIIQRQAEDPKTSRQAAHALQAAERAAKLTQQLLAFSRSQKLVLEPVNINQLVAGMNDLLDRTIGADAHVELVLDQREPWAFADKNQLELAILNLAINARDAMSEGGDIVIASSIEEGSFPDVDASRFGVISVSDSGSGIPGHLIEKVFDPFFTTKPVGKGTGLGLSQVYGIARQSGGTVRIDSEAETGTKVSIWLPLTRKEERSELSEQKTTAAQYGQSREVLVVEDDPAVRQFIVDGLQSHGFNVRHASDGSIALDELEAGQPDLMIVDFAMPGMNGAELVKKVCSIYPGLPVVLATGYADMNAVEKVIPADRVLRKPFMIEDLVGAINDAIGDSVAS